MRPPPFRLQPHSPRPTLAIRQACRCGRSPCGGSGSSERADARPARLMGTETSGAPAVTIVLPTYNRASFLPEAFASIERQTFHDWELVVVDDGSTDDTRSMVERF